MKLVEFSNLHKHDKKYLICDNIQNVDNMLKHEKEYINNLEKVRIVDLAKDIIIRDYAKKKIIRDINIIDNEYQVILMSNILSENISFIPSDAVSNATVSELIRVMNIIREARYIGLPNKRIDDINKLIALYEKELEEKDLFDEISLIKYAKTICKEDNNIYAILDNVNERLTYLEKSFIDSLSKDIKVIDTSFNYQNNYEFVSVYGEYNEIDSVLNDIKNKDLALSDCEIILTNSLYEPIVRTNLGKNNIPYAYTSKYHIYDHPYISFIKDVFAWASNNYSYKDFKKILENPCIKQNLVYMEKEEHGEVRKQYLYQLGIDAGIGYSLKRYQDFLIRLDDLDKFFDEIKNRNLGIDKDYIDRIVIEEYKDFLKKFLNVFDSKDINEMMNELINIIRERNDVLEHNVLDNIIKHSAILKEIRYQTTFKEKMQIIASMLDNIKLCDNDDANKLNVHLFSGFNVLQRKNVYVIGMSYDAFELKLKDSPILTDKEILAYCDNHYYLDLALTKAKERNEDFMRMIKSCDAHINFIRTNYNTSEFRMSIPSLMYNSLRKNQDEIVLKNEYINRTSIKNDEIIKRNVDLSRNLNLVNKYQASDGHMVYELKSPLTASNLNKIMICPLSYLYYLNYFSEEAEEENPYQWLNSMEKGNFYHSILEEYCRDLIDVSSKDLGDEYDCSKFESIFNKFVQIYRDNVVCPSEAIFASELSDYKEDLIKYLNNMHREFKEKGIKVKNVESLPNEAGLSKKISIGANGKSYDEGAEDKRELIISFKANTRIDREDLYENDNKLRIVDYKTAKNPYDKTKLNHNLQWFVYSYLEEAYEFEYHFLCNKKEDDIVRITKQENEFKSLNDEIGLKLFDFFVNENIEVLEEDDEDDLSCNNCDYKKICLKMMAIKKGGIK